MLRTLALSLLASLAAPVAGAQNATALIERDARLFAMSAALNAAGFDVELAAEYHPVRQLLRENLEDLDANLVRRLGEFYTSRRGEATDVDQLAAYVSLALSVTPPPELDLLYEPDRMPPDAWSVRGFLPLVRELYVEANLGALWEVLEPSYEASLDRLASPIRRALVETEAYLRIPQGRAQDRRAMILLELSLPVNSVNLRNYPDNFFVVLGESSSPPIVDIRHGYLHVLLDPQVAIHRNGDVLRAGELLSLVEGVAGVRSDFVFDAEAMVAESLIGAIELRLDGAGNADLDRAYRSGLLLAPYFHERLIEFEDAEVGIRQHLPELMSDVDVGREIARFEARFDTIPVPDDEPVLAEVPVAPTRANPVRELLEEAQTAFNEGRNEAAESSFLGVLELDPANGPAFYGLALLASRAQDSDRAREYFDRTIASGTTEPGMIVWSHVYLGRIEDLSCNREAALGHYRSAAGMGDDTRGAQAAASQGLEAPYGGNC